MGNNRAGMNSFNILVSLGLILGSTFSAIAKEQPNIVIILADDCTFRDIGCYGGQAQTPQIDKLASEGMLFQNCFQAAPMCSPTRHNLYTGLYPVKSGAYPNHTMVYPDVQTVVHYLGSLGYRVAQTGKLHVRPSGNFPWERLGKGWGEPKINEVSHFFAEHNPESTRKKQRPFCLFVCSNSPHSPWNQGDASVYPPEKIQLPPYLVDTAELRENFSRYLAEVSHFDSQVGAVVEALNQHGLRDSTLVMVLSEQGNSFPFAKWTCYDSGLQSAMVVRWPGQVPAGSASQAMVEYVDVTPTLIDAAGGAPIRGLDGKSFLPVLRQETDHHKDCVFGIMTTRGILSGSDAYAIRSVRNKRFKLIRNLNHESPFQNICMETDFYQSMIQKAKSGDADAKRLVHAYMHRPAVEFYDLQHDPLELSNLAEDPKHADVRAELDERLEAWMLDQGDLGVLTERTAHLRQPKQTPTNRRITDAEVVLEAERTAVTSSADRN